MSDDGNLRESLGISSYYLEEDEKQETQPVRVQPASSGLVLGMTAPQRFVVALMLCLLTSIIGTLILILADKVVLPV